MQGFVPASFVTELVASDYTQLDIGPQLFVGPSPSWYHGTVAREACEPLLARASENSFLLRGSDRSKGDYSLSLNIGAGKVKHFKISQNGPNWAFGERIFASVTALVDFYAVKTAIYTNDKGKSFFLSIPLEGQIKESDYYKACFGAQ